MRDGALDARACTRCRDAIDREVARLKLASLGVEIDALTAEQAQLPVVLGSSGPMSRDTD